ncbi:MAG: hypothetical protein E7080_09260 [Bacteroidales bacterium]|nr:hypothetical protein [Bacteroidales bacterium]
MKLRKILATAAMALFVGATAMAQTPTVENVRIYINPGHGAFDSGSRPMGTVKHGANNAYSDANNDTANFFESNTNLQKGLAMLEKLISFGVPFDRTKNQTNDNPHRIGAALDLSQNIVFSRVKNGAYPPYTDYDAHTTNPESAYYDRSLSEISAEVEFNDFDLFVSIHSNALTEGTNTNYPLILYRGTDAQEGNPGSIAVSKACWPYLTGMGHQQWTAYKSSMNVRGDHTFYGSSYTNTFIVPDGYEYDPNTEFSEYIEGTNGNPDTVKFVGYLGVLRHGTTGFLSEGYFHTYQPARHRYMNWDVCHLEGHGYAYGIADYFGWDKKITTGVIYGVVRDKHEKFSHEFYKPNSSTNDAYMPLNNVVVTLKKDGAEVATYTTDDEWNGAFVFHVEPGTYTIECSHADYKPLAEPLEVTVKAGENVYPEPMLENVAYEPPAIVYVDYPDEITEADIKAASSYNVNNSYTNIEIPELEGATIRRTEIKDNVMYILALKADNSPVLLAYNLVEMEVVSQLGTSVCTGSHLALSDIQLTADGVLVGCAKNQNAYNGTPRVEFYIWKNDSTGVASGEAVKWFDTNKTGNFNNAYVGNTFYYEGTMEEGTIVLSAETTGSTTNVWNAICSVVDSVMVSDGSFARPDDVHAKNKFGEDYTYHLSPITEGWYVVTGSNHLPMEIILSDDVTTNVVLAEGLLNKPTAKIEFFKYAGSSFMVAADEVEGKAVVKLINVTNGFDKAKLVDVVLPESVDLSTLSTTASVNGRTVVKRDADENLTDYWIELYFLNGNKITKLTTQSVEQPVVRGEYAYNLAMTEAEGVYTLTFDVTGADATDANVILTHIEGDSIATTIPVAVKAGANSVTVDGTELAEGTYSWVVEVNGKAIATPAQIHVDGSIATKPGSYWNRGGVAIDADAESDNYGKVYVTGGYGKGIQVVDQQLQSEGIYLGNKFDSSNGSSPLRCATSEGKLYITDWSDGKSGIWVFDPAQRDALSNVFDESTRQSGGEFKNADGTVTGGGTTGVSFIGKGENRKMFMFCEDYPSTNGQTPVGYDLGTADNWASAPTYIYDGIKGLLINTNVEVNACEEGVFWSQIRNSGQNTSGVPSFIFADYEGNLVFSSGESMKDLDGSLGAGFALNNDKTICAIANGSANVNIYEFAFVDGVPTFNFLYEVVVSGASEINEICFDAANNMYVFGRGVGLAVYSLPQDAPKAVTPAKAALTLKGTKSASAIDVIEVDANAPVEYYNLQGVKVANPENGIFIKKQGNKATKVIL